MNKTSFIDALGARTIESEKPVVLFDDYDGTALAFDTVDNALEFRNTLPWAELKWVFKYNPETGGFERIQRDGFN